MSPWVGCLLPPRKLAVQGYESHFSIVGQFRCIFVRIRQELDGSLCVGAASPAHHRLNVWSHPRAGLDLGWSWHCALHLPRCSCSHAVLHVLRVIVVASLIHLNCRQILSFSQSPMWSVFQSLPQLCFSSNPKSSDIYWIHWRLRAWTIGHRSSLSTCRMSCACAELLKPRPCALYRSACWKGKESPNKICACWIGLDDLKSKRSFERPLKYCPHCYICDIWRAWTENILPIVWQIGLSDGDVVTGDVDVFTSHHEVGQYCGLP